MGFFIEDQSDLSADLVFASVAKLARSTGLARLAGESFDYVVVDEVHHAAAESYRRILGALAPGFLLGLTATPDRADAANILGLFDDHLAYEAGIARGIELGRLVPFHYLGVKGDIDYRTIPWRSSRFEPEALARAVETERRMATLWRAWQEHPGRRTLVFCCSIQHAQYVRAWLRDRGVQVAAVFSAEGTDDRESSLHALDEGKIDAICAVDLFNEGVDLPSLDRVILLRPTESSVVFLQQLGRGLRACEQKSHVTVIDFVGNHRIFVERLHVLLSASGGQAEALHSLLHQTIGPELPAGCSVELELEAKNLLLELFRVSGVDEVERAYRQLRFERGERPRAGELQRAGFLLSKLRRRHGGWFDFVRAEKDLSGAENEAFQIAAAFLRDLEATAMTLCFKMITLEAMLDAEALVTGMALPALALRCHAILRRSPDLFADVPAELRVQVLTPELEHEWIAYWRKNPIEAWIGGPSGSTAWFRLESGRFKLSLPSGADSLARIEPVLSRRVSELVDYRLALYRTRASTRQSAGVSHEAHYPVTGPVNLRAAEEPHAGPRRTVSRELPAEALERARKLATGVLALPAAERWLTRSGGGRARVLGPSKQGGLRIDGGDGGFKERTVSLTDLGWALLAQDQALERGGQFDEALVNRLRYPEATPRASTRWIDTGWAIAACSLAVRH